MHGYGGGRLHTAETDYMYIYAYVLRQCICMYVCACVFVCVYICENTQRHTTYVHTRIHVQIHARTHTHTHTHIHVCDIHITDFSDSLHLNPNDAACFANRSAANYSLGKLEEALDDADRFFPPKIFDTYMHAFTNTHTHTHTHKHTHTHTHTHTYIGIHKHKLTHQLFARQA